MCTPKVINPYGSVICYTLYSIVSLRKHFIYLFYVFCAIVKKYSIYQLFLCLCTTVCVQLCCLSQRWFELQLDVGIFLYFIKHRNSGTDFLFSLIQNKLFFPVNGDSDNIHSYFLFPSCLRWIFAMIQKTKTAWK